MIGMGGIDPSVHTLKAEVCASWLRHGHPMVQTLLSMDRRIHLYQLFGDIKENQGFFLDKDGIYIPYMIPAIEHEIAHFVEIRNTNRWTLPDWGIKPLTRCTGAAVFAAVARETRVRAIQLHITQFDSEEQRESSTPSLLKNPWWTEVVSSALPFGRFQSMNEVEVWVHDLHHKTYQSWNGERIHHEWSVRLRHIQHWMEKIN